MKSLTSDNQSGVHPDIMDALFKANVEHAQAYGADEESRHAQALFRQHFGPCEVFFVFNGTAANVLCLQALLQPHESVLCADSSHLWVDECGAPERFLGSKLIPLPHRQGKLEIDTIKSALIRRGDQHHSQPKVVSIAQPTEYGTVYTLDEIAKIVSFCHAQGLRVHVDGARLANAAASLNVSLAALTREVGIDALSFGGTKNGMMFGEAVVLFHKSDAKHFNFVRKQAMQLGSKARFIAAQFNTLLSNELWLHNAKHVNAMAQRLADGVASVPGVTLSAPVQANAVFAQVPQRAIAPLREHTHFYVWNEHTFEVRWMTSFDTTEAEIDAFIAALRKICR